MPNQHLVIRVLVSRAVAVHGHFVKLTLQHIEKRCSKLHKEDIKFEGTILVDDALRSVVDLALLEVLDFGAARAIEDASPLISQWSFNFLIDLDPDLSPHA